MTVLRCSLFVLLFASNSLLGFAQDSTYYISAYAGGHIIVPEDETWVIDRAFVNDGDAYSIQISNSNFKPSYTSGDTIQLPYYSADMELLDDTDMVQYQLYYRKESD